MHEFLTDNAAFLPAHRKAIRESPSKSIFRIRAKVAMARRDLNVTELAKALGVSRVTCSQAINHGLHNPTRRRIAAFLGIAA